MSHGIGSSPLIVAMPSIYSGGVASSRKEDGAVGQQDMSAFEVMAPHLLAKAAVDDVLHPVGLQIFGIEPCDSRHLRFDHQDRGGHVVLSEIDAGRVGIRKKCFRAADDHITGLAQRARVGIGGAAVNLRHVLGKLCVVRAIPGLVKS